MQQAQRIRKDLIVSENDIKAKQQDEYVGADVEKAVEPKKIEKKAAPKPVKKYYSVRIEATAPISLSYRILADDAAQALEIIEKTPHNAQMDRPPKPNLQRGRKGSATVYMYNSSSILLTKKY